MERKILRLGIVARNPSFMRWALDRAAARRLAARSAPEMCSAVRPSAKEGTGKAGHRLIPMARVQKESTRRSPQDQPDIRPSLRDGLTAYTRSPRCAGLFGHRHLREAELPANLILASEYQDHAISPSSSRRSSTCMAHAATESGHHIPHQRFVTFAKRPSDRAGCADQIMNSEKKKQESFSRRDWTGQISLRMQANFVFRRR